MNFLNGIVNGFVEIWAHKLRSALTAVSVMLGVAALVVVMGLLEGVFAESDESFREFGGLERIWVNPGELPKSQRHLAARQRGTTLADAKIIDALTGDAQVLPSWEKRFDARGRGGSLEVEVRAVQPAFFAGDQWPVERGRALSPLDGRDRARVAVIGSAVREKCFPAGQDPLGGTIVVDEEAFRVVGVLAHFQRDWNGRNLLDRKNATVIVPLETALATLMEEPALEELAVDAVRVEDVGGLMHRVVNILVQAQQGLRGVEARSNLEFFEDFQKVRLTFFVAGGLVGGISLLVGGIGIMNLMMASVNERIREIGIRKAVGAWPRDVFVQFVAEAVTLSSLGGLAGLALGRGVIALLAHTAQESAPIFSPTVATVGFVFSVGVGIVAGVYPAFRAARMDPVDALRHE